MAKSTAVAPREAHSIIQRLQSSDKMRTGGDDPEAIAFSIAQRIAEAQTPEDVLSGPGKVTHARDVLMQPFMLEDVELVESELNESIPVYMLMHVTRNGQPDVITCGGLSVMVAALRLTELDALPRMVMIMEAEEKTAAGYRPLWLIAPTTVTNGSAADTDADTYAEPFE